MLRSKILVVIFGALLVGGAGATVGVLSAARANSALAGTVASSSTATASASTADATATATRGATPSPTATNVPAPTATPSGSQQVTLHGRVVSVNTSANTFVLNWNGTSVTCMVDANTSWSGTASGLNSLQTGMKAAVQGTYQGSGMLQAAAVNAQWDD
jgi:hypothetical protein